MVNEAHPAPSGAHLYLMYRLRPFKPAVVDQVERT
jgi:hypothetical protein